MSSLKFGTSGLRGLVVDLLGSPSYAFTLAFLHHDSQGDSPRKVLIGRDLRSSSPAIAALCIAAARDAGYTPFDCGAVPTPALALAAMKLACSAVMVTGSHIPDDRNGLKFYRADGEITKDDEACILAALDDLGALDTLVPTSADDATPHAALEAYVARSLDFFAPDTLAGLTIGIYEQSTVARDVLTEVLKGLGAKTVSLGRSETFIPVDTEAHREEDKALIAGWAKGGDFDAFVSADGDADRPLVADETGTILRGDIIGLLTSAYLGMGTIVTPVTSASAIERTGIAKTVIRTRVGSPFVIARMAEADAAGGVIGFEANGGVLLGTDVVRGGRLLKALPTRDAMLPIVSVLASIAEKKQGLSAIVAGLDAGHTASHRLQEVPAVASGAFLAKLLDDAGYRHVFTQDIGEVVAVDRLDGAHMRLADNTVIHYRASGNAPELRCYVEASSANRAKEVLAWGLKQAAEAVGSL